MKDDTMNNNSSASEDTRGDNFSELNGFQDYDNPDSIPPSIQKQASDVTVPVPLAEEAESADIQTIMLNDPNAPTVRTDTVAEEGSQAQNAMQAEDGSQPSEPNGQVDGSETAGETTPALLEALPESVSAPKTLLAEQEEAAETKREVTQPIETPQMKAESSPAWFNEIASFDEKTASSAPKPPAETRSREDYFTGAWVKPMPAQKPAENTWNSKPYGAWIPPSAPKPPVLQDNIPTIPPEASAPTLAPGSQPLPLKKVTETDPGATQLSSSAFAQRQDTKTSGTQPVQVAPAKSPRRAESKPQAGPVPTQTIPVQPRTQPKKPLKSALPFLFVFVALIFTA